MFTRSLPRFQTNLCQNTFIKSPFSDLKSSTPLKGYKQRFCTNQQTNLSLSQRNFTDSTYSKKPSNFLRLLGGALLAAGGIYMIKKHQKLQSDLEILNSRINSNALEKETSIIPSSPSHQPLGIVNVDKVAEFEPFYSKKNLKEIMGYESELNIIADYVRYLQNPDEFTKGGVAAPKGFILSGEPGVGKTFLAEAVAGHSGVPIIMISGAEFQKPYVGQSEEAMRKLFAQTKQIAPCVVLIDEIDALGKRITDQNTTNAHYINSQIDQFLKLLSDDHPGVIFIGTTNHIELIDPALIRPGRFDKKIHLSLPSHEGRIKILQHHTTGKKLASNVSFNTLATLSSNLSGAALATWVNEAAMNAQREKSKEIDIKHFDLALSVIQIGIPGKSSSNLQKKYHTAIHESGHTLVGLLLNRKVYKTTIRTHGPSEGHTHWIEEDKLQTKQHLLDNICILLAGRAAELVLETPTVGSATDFNHAKLIATNMIKKEAMGDSIFGTEQNIEKVLQEQLSRACLMIKEHRETWERITNALIDKEDLFADDLSAILEDKSYKKEKSFFGKKTSSPSSELSLNLPPIKEVVETTSNINGIRTGSSAKTSNDEKDSKKLPFTREEVARALALDVNKIRKIDSYANGCKIVFKPSFDDHSHMERQSKHLKTQDVENYYFTHDRELTVTSDGMEDFIIFIKKHGKE